MCGRRLSQPLGIVYYPKAMLFLLPIFGNKKFYVSFIDIFQVYILIHTLRQFSESRPLLTCWITQLVSKYNIPVTILKRAEQWLCGIKDRESMLPFIKKHMCYLKTYLVINISFAQLRGSLYLHHSSITKYPYLLCFIFILFSIIHYFISSPLSFILLTLY